MCPCWCCWDSRQEAPTVRLWLLWLTQSLYTIQHMTIDSLCPRTFVMCSMVQLLYILIKLYSILFEIVLLNVTPKLCLIQLCLILSLSYPKLIYSWPSNFVDRTVSEINLYTHTIDTCLDWCAVYYTMLFVSSHSHSVSFAMSLPCNETTPQFTWLFLTKNPASSSLSFLSLSLSLRWQKWTGSTSGGWSTLTSLCTAAYVGACYWASGNEAFPASVSALSHH
jgi:hypothetical protein